MKTKFKKTLWISLCCVVGLGIVTVLFHWQKGRNLREGLAEIRRTLRAQGFKTDVADFDVTTNYASRARSEALAISNSPLEPLLEMHLDLLPVASDNTATVFWKQDSLNIARRISDWSDLQTLLEANRMAYEAACDAALAGPIRLAPGENGEILLHLSAALCSRTMLELHRGHPNAAWTNLISATRLATAWETGPSGTSHLFRSHLTQLAFAATWQALQNEVWTDASLTELQQEWESVDFFANLPETAALACAAAVERCHIEARQPPLGNRRFSDFAREVIADPRDAFSELRNGVRRKFYSNRGVLVDEKNLLLYFHHREIQLRHAIGSPTWVEMKAQPGVINPVPFASVSEDVNRYIGFSYSELNLVTARAAEAEARRRILITALALERYCRKHGVYPATLAPLAPEFLRTVPVDFMDGQPLRYGSAEDGYFSLYSVGLDCVDDGGKMPRPNADTFPIDGWGLYRAPRNMDIVWPRPNVSHARASHQ